MDNLAIINGIKMKSICTIIPKELQRHALEQIRNNHIGIDKTRLQVCESIYCVNMNANIENTINIVTYVLIFTGYSLSREYLS